MIVKEGSNKLAYYILIIFFNNENISAFRTVFGDERANYGESLTNYYKNGTPNYWNRNYISEYASSHPWEDWAETWAHYLHLMDTLETANAFGLTFNSNNIFPNGLTVSNFGNPYQIRDFKHIFESSMALTCAANSLNRSMGLPDIYPFVIPHNVFLKLNFIHNTLSPYRIFN